MTIIDKVEPKPASDKAVRFLEKWNPLAPWVLTAIDPYKKGIETATFYPKDKDKLLTWLNKYNGERNIYFHVNSVMYDLTKKASKADIKSADWLHVDIDPREGQDIEKEREHILDSLTNKLPKGLLEPTVITFSGGGFQAFWKLKEPLVINGDLELAAKAELYNKRLEEIFDADNCHNIDRIMRLPGTVNIPDTRKLKKGRKRELATLLHFESTNPYSISEFTPAKTARGGGVDAQNIAVNIGGNITHLESLDELDKWNVSDRIKVIIVQGNHPEQPKDGDSSRSAWLFDVVCSLVRCNVPDDIIYSIITDKGFAISESVLEASNPEQYAIRQIERAKEQAIEPWLRKLNDNFAVIGDIGGKCRVIAEVMDYGLKRTRISRQSFEDFRNRHMNIKVQCGETADGRPKYSPLGKWWLEHEYRHQYDSIVFAPNHEVPSNLFNLWKGFSVEARQGDWSLMQKHIKEVIACDNIEHYDYIIKWLAFAMQHPDTPAEVVIVLKGGKGTGKGMFATAICELFGQHGMSISNPQHLVGNFNAHLEDTCLLFADEAFWPGYKKMEGVLKSLITEKTLAIEKKGVDATPACNRLHIIMASNEEWIVPASIDERRFAVFEISDKYQQNTEYFSALSGELKNGGREAMLYDLLHTNIDGWYPRDNVPQTEALNEQKLGGLNDIQRTWFDCLVSGEINYHDKHGDLYHLPTKVFAAQVLSNSRYKNTTDHAIGMFLGTPRTKQQKQCMGFKKESTCRPRGYLIPELSEARAIWDKTMIPYKWDSATEWVQEYENVNSPF